jgi:hypothetical protein
MRRDISTLDRFDWSMHSSTASKIARFNAQAWASS